MENEKHIAENILTHRRLEKQCYVNIWAVGRWSVIYNGNPNVFWMIRKENKGQNRGQFALTKNGKPIYYNSKLGETLQRNFTGDFTIETPEGKRKLTILNRVLYIPNKHNIDARDLRFSINGQENKLEYRSLKEFLNIIELKQNEIKSKEKELENATIQNLGQAAIESITKEIALKEKEKEQIYNARQAFIRDQMHLQKQLHLGDDQNDAKRSMIFDGTMIIDGGPGTGKTTSLIERIKFLIDPIALKEYYPELSTSSLNLITDPNQSNWIFFSPSILLSEYLKDSMEQEELMTDSSHLKVWEDFKKEVLESYGLIGKDSKASFILSPRSHSEPIINKAGDKVKELTNKLETYSVSFYKKRLEKATSINVANYSWKNIGEAIQKLISSNINSHQYITIVKLYHNLHQQFGKRVGGIVQDALKARTKFANTLQKSLDTHQLNTLRTHLYDEEASIDKDNSESIQVDLTNFLKSLVRKIAISNFEKVSFNSTDKILLNVLPPIERKQYKSLGDLLLLQKYMSSITKGVASNLLSRVPSMYKSFLKNEIKNNSIYWNKEQLNKKSDSSKGIYLDPIEAALILNYINEKIIVIANNNQTLFKSLKHDYVFAYNDHRKCVIAVDEASDMHPIDLKCIHSFRHYSISSVTYSGDIMQRMTIEGIRKWEELFELIPDADINKLSISYRQSPTLIELAKKVYKQTNNELPEYRSKKAMSSDEPKPLLYISKTESSRLSWIANRINDIITIYKEIAKPTIAIFVSEEQLVLPTTELLVNKFDKLNLEVKIIPCLEGKDLGNEFAIRVFSIEHIKGLEFEAVFFHNLDGLEKNINIQEDLALKFLYVGISRATFYLAVTASDSFKGNLMFLNSTLSNDLSWTIRI